MKISLKKALQQFGATDIEIHRGYNYRSGFYNKDQQLWYFCTSDLRTPLSILNRTAKDRRDYTGGVNCYDIEDWLRRNNYVLYIPRVKGDFNQC